MTKNGGPSCRAWGDGSTWSTPTRRWTRRTPRASGGRSKRSTTRSLSTRVTSRSISVSGLEFEQIKSDGKLPKPAVAKDEYCILAKERLVVFGDKKYEVVKEMKGKDLVGKKYKPVFDDYAKNEKLENRERGWKVYAADFVTTESGTGIVHIAPAFGEDDMELGKKE